MRRGLGSLIWGGWYHFSPGYTTKTDLVFVQPGAKITCLLRWERTRTRFTAGNSQYLEQRLRIPAGWSTCTPFTPHCRLAAFQCAWVQWTRNLVAEQSASKSHGLFSVRGGGVAADGVSSQNFRHWSAEASSDRLMGSADPEHTEPSDWSAAKKTDDGYQGKERSCWIKPGLTICVNDRSCFTVFRLKTE